MDTTAQLPTVLSLCTGYGGIERGLDLAGFKHRVITHVEIEAFAIANLVNKMEQGKLVPAPIWTDLKTLNGRGFRGAIDLLTGGYPCQPFSNAGKRNGTEDSRHLYPFIERIIEDDLPRRVFFENVEGHIAMGLREVLNSLECRGYKTAWGIFSASEAGAPQQRKRVYIMGDAYSVLSGLSKYGGLSDTKGKRVQGLWPSRKQEPDTHGQAELSVCESERSGHANWKAEPDVGRVVDGCPDRVDRIRLLGNGVVPHTAAIAWQTLSKELT